MSKERELLTKVTFQMDAFIEGQYWPNVHLLLDEINEELAKPEELAKLEEVLLNALEEIIKRDEYRMYRTCFDDIRSCEEKCKPKQRCANLPHSNIGKIAILAVEEYKSRSNTQEIK